jgi:hypothetical protein
VTRAFASWLTRGWIPKLDPALLESYRIAFSGEHGAQVLQHLLDNIYCRVYEGADSNAALIHNARRSVVHEILENIDRARWPEKYLINTEVTDGLAG